MSEPVVRPRSLQRAESHGHTGAERVWTPIGTVDAGVLGTVDDAGAIRPAGTSWCLDWWIGAEDRWHHPSREASVRQRALDGSPVVETALRAPGGDVVARAFGAVASAGEWRGPAIVVEVENRTAVPVALALVVRPLTLDGDGSVTSVRSSGAEVVVDGTRRLLLSRYPARAVAGALDEVAPRLAAGDDVEPPVDAERRASDLEVALVVPLTHGATSRVLIPAHDVGRRRGAPEPTWPWDAPTAEAVAKGWAAHTGDDLRIVAPEPGWSEALGWASAMLRLAGPDELGACLDRDRPTSPGPSAAVRAAEVAEAMARVGAVDGLTLAARALAEAQRLGGAVRLGDGSDGTVALVHAAAGVVAAQPDPDSDALADVLAPAAVAIRRLRRGHGTDGGLAPSAVRALRALAPGLVSVGQPEVAEDALAVARSLGGVDAPSAVRLVEPAEHGPRSTLAAALVARSLVLGRAGSDAVAAVRALWDGVAEHGRSDAEEGDRRSPRPVGTTGFDVAELAARTNALLDVFAVDATAGPALLPAFDTAWYGQPFEAHGLRTPWGRVSYAVRWHGDRPALLWETASSAEAATVPEVSAPGLDPSWRAAASAGEALLAAPAGVPALDGPAPSDPGSGDPAPVHDTAVHDTAVHDTAAPDAAAGGPDGSDDSPPGEGESFG